MNRGGEREGERAEGKMSGADGFDWEAHVANRGLLGQQNFVEVNRAAVRLQRWWRRVRQRRRQRAEVAKVIFMQARIRRFIQRRRYLRLRAILGIQTNFRMMRTRTQYKMQMAKIIKCQSLIKAFLVRRLYLEVLKEKRAALAVQRWWRMVKQRRKRVEENARIKAEGEQIKQEEASVRKKKTGEEEDEKDETVTTRPEQVDVPVTMGSPQSERREVEGMRTRDTRGKELVTSPPHNVEPDT